MSKEWAIETTRKIFQNTTEESISLRDIFIKFERQNYEEDKNKAWFSNILSNVKKHNLLTPLYTQKRGKRVLDRVKLTLEAKTILGWYAATGHIVPSSSINPSLLSERTEEPRDDLSAKIRELISDFNRKNPDVEGEFVVRLKGN